MTIRLPLLPQGTQTLFGLTTKARILDPTSGGPKQVIKSGGERFNVQIQSQALDYGQAMAYVSVLLRGLTDIIQVPFQQPGIDTSKAGSPVVTGGGGLSLSISGAGTIQQGQYFTIVHNGRSYLHLAAADFSGSGILSITPMLRFTPSSGDQLIFGQPYIEGYVDGGAQQWSVGMVANLGLSLSVTEAA